MSSSPPLLPTGHYGSRRSSCFWVPTIRACPPHTTPSRVSASGGSLAPVLDLPGVVAGVPGDPPGGIWDRPPLAGVQAVAGEGRAGRPGSPQGRLRPRACPPTPAPAGEGPACGRMQTRRPARGRRSRPYRGRLREGPRAARPEPLRPNGGRRPRTPPPVPTGRLPATASRCTAASALEIASASSNRGPAISHGANRSRSTPRRLTSSTCSASWQPLQLLAGVRP